MIRSCKGWRLMPIYEYSCQECGAEFEKLLIRTSAEKDLVCPECGARELNRKFSLFAAGGSCSPGAGKSPFR